MIQPLLRIALEPVAARHRQFRLFISLGVAWAALSVIGLMLWLSGITGLLLPPLLAITAGVAYWFLKKRAEAWDPDWQSVARTVEQGHPDLHALLVTAVEQHPDPKTGELHFLQQRVIQDAIAESRKRPWLNAVPRSRIWGAAALQFLLLAGFVGVLVKLEGGALGALRQGKAARSMVADEVTVSPGDTELERGSGLVVLATFNRDVPGSATLVFQPTNGPEQRAPLTRNLEDPVFGGGLPEIDTDLTYRIEHSGRSTRTFTVRVFEHPRMERADAHLRFPDYTKLPEKEIPDTRRVSAVEGSKLDLTLALNKPVKSARLVGKNGAVVPLSVDPKKATARLEGFDLRTSDTYTLQLEDADGRASKVSSQFVLEALSNRRPEIKLASPRGDQRVSPLQEVAYLADAWDDFGIISYGLSYTVAAGETKVLELGRDIPADQKVQGSHLLKLEELGVKPDELVSWHAWAEDIGPDGKPRRTESDIFFGEVRPFEEIYKAGQNGEGQQQQQGGAGGEAAKLAETQKQIITATWNLRRNEGTAGTAALSEKYRKDAPVIRDSQKEVLKQAEKLRENLDQPKSQALAENVTRHMTSAVEHLERATESTVPLPEALQTEQAAYNALLKLAAHEFNVTRNSSSQQGGQQGGNRQQQLDQLELKDERKRYETKREAAPQQNQEQQEQLAILNRLKELAQRQQDINERLKELQTALQEAKTEAQKEEVQRELKRLREEEQQLLADMDETRQKMDASANASQFSEERRQMEQTRNDAQQAAESMERQDASGALASGTRAQRDLQQMRDEFRKKTSGQFREEMRDLRSDTRELAENQQKISEQLAETQQPGAGTPTRRSLDGSSPNEQLAQQFQQQQEQLKDVEERMQQLSEQAEAAEPLLARELYDTLRKTSQAGTKETLDRAGQLARRGFTPQAKSFEERARHEIEELKTGVERAAESVLGDEAQALRLAQAELDALSRQIDRELAQADPNGSARRPGRQPGDQQPGQDSQQGRNGNAPGEDRQGEPGTQEGQNRSQQPGQTAQNQQGQSRGQGTPKGEPKEGEQPGESQQAGQTAQNQQQQGQSRGGEGKQPGERPDDRQQTAQAGERGSSSQQGGQGENGQPGETNQSQSSNSQQMADANSQSRQGNRGGQQGGEQQASGQQAGGQQGGQQTGRNQQQGSQTASASGNGGGSNDSSSQPDEADPSTRPGARLRELASTGPRERGGIRSGASEGGGDQGGGAEFTEGPIRGEGFVEWSDRLRNVEEMLDDPKLRAEVARVREVARGVRVESKRHSKEPKWDVVRTQVKEPLAELRNRVTEELARRDSRESLVPIDRDPVPAQFVEHVRRYYEELGRSR